MSMLRDKEVNNILNIQKYYSNDEVNETMQLRLLRIDETMLPFMNGDGLEDVPTFMDCASHIEYTKKRISYLERVSKITTWRDFFVKLDQLLMDSKETQHRDLAGVSIVNGVIRPIWVR